MNFHRCARARLDTPRVDLDGARRDPLSQSRPDASLRDERKLACDGVLLSRSDGVGRELVERPGLPRVLLVRYSTSTSRRACPRRASVDGRRPALGRNGPRCRRITRRRARRIGAGCGQMKCGAALSRCSVDSDPARRPRPDVEATPSPRTSGDPRRRHSSPAPDALACAAGCPPSLSSRSTEAPAASTRVPPSSTRPSD